MAAIVERLATLSTRFSQNVLADEAAYQLVLHDERDLAGLPESVRAAAGAAARQRGEADGWVITLSRSLIVPFLTFSDRRDLREQAFHAWIRRGENDGDARQPPGSRARSSRCGSEQARLHGYANYADYALVDRMAGTPAAVAQAARRRCGSPRPQGGGRARGAARECARSRGATHPIEPWDWRYYAEKVRTTRYGFDDARAEALFLARRGCSRRRSTPRSGCSASSFVERAGPSAPTTPTCASSRCATATAGRSASS